MDHFSYKDGHLYAEDVAINEIAAAVGTPFYCYSSATLERHYRVFDEALAGLDHSICYAVKANSNIAVIATLAQLGAGADVVSIGEFRRARAAGVAAADIVFSGVGKTRHEMAEALKAGLRQINVESDSELDLLSEVATSLGLTAPVAIRINPDVDAQTHEKISTGKAENKFGVDLAIARQVYGRAAGLPGIRLQGVAVHIGSQLTDLAPYREAYRRTVEFLKVLRGDGHAIDHLDLGGGLGITYDDEQAPSPLDYGAMVTDVVGDLDCHVTFEPGRVITGNAGILVTRVLYTKAGTARHFCIVDAAMNDLIRPTLYNAYHEIVPVAAPADGATLIEMDVVGPICESGDFLAKGRVLPDVGPDELLAVRTAGAYGAVMASAYNTRPPPAEVLVRGGDFSVVRRRQTVEELIDQESLPDWLAEPVPNIAEAGG